MDSVFSSLSLIIAFATGMALLMRLIGQPLIIGHIITGILVGPAVLKIGNSPEVFTIFSEIGIALLLFVIGLNLNPKVIKDVGKSAATIGVFQIAVIGLIGWIAGIRLGMGGTGSVFFGAALAFSSTIIALKLLSDKHEQNRLHGRLTTGVLLTQDVVAAFALLLAASAGSHSFSIGSLLAIIVKGLAIGAIFYWLASDVLPKWHKLIAGSQEFLFLFAIGWALGVAALFTKAGLSLEIGALFAGVCLASLPYAQEISARLRPVRDFFVVVFFITLGSGLSFSGGGHLVAPVIIGLLIVLLIKPLVVLARMGSMGYTKRTSFKTAISISQTSEFSIVLVTLGVSRNVIGADVAIILTFITLISIAASSYMSYFSDRLYKVVDKYLNVFIRERAKSENDEHQAYQMILFGYQKGGHEFIKTFKQLGRSFVVVDYDPEIIEHLERRKINCMYGDATDPELLEEAGADRAELIVSAITDQQSNLMLLDYLTQHNPEAVVICQGDSAKEGVELYERGASYVILPHYIGSEQIGSFIKKSDLKKAPFNQFRSKHLSRLKTQQKAMTDLPLEDTKEKIGASIVKNIANLKPKN